MSVTSSECQRLGTQGEQIERHAVHAGAEIDQQLKQVEQGLMTSGEAARAQFHALRGEMGKLKDSMHGLQREVVEHKRLTGDVHTRLQTQLRNCIEGRKRAQDNQQELLNHVATFQKTMAKSAHRIAEVKAQTLGGSTGAPAGALSTS